MLLPSGSTYVTVFEGVLVTINSTPFGCSPDKKSLANKYVREGCELTGQFRNAGSRRQTVQDKLAAPLQLYTGNKRLRG